MKTVTFAKKGITTPVYYAPTQETIICLSNSDIHRPCRLISLTHAHFMHERKRLYDDLGVEHIPYTLRLETKMRYQINDPWRPSSRHAKTYLIPVFRMYSLFKQPLYRGHSWHLDRVLRRLKEYPDMIDKFMMYHYDYK